MKIIYSITIASLFLFGTALFPWQVNAVVCQNKTVIVGVGVESVTLPQNSK